MHISISLNLSHFEKPHTTQKRREDFFSTHQLRHLHKITLYEKKHELQGINLLGVIVGVEHCWYVLVFCVNVKCDLRVDGMEMAFFAFFVVVVLLPIHNKN